MIRKSEDRVRFRRFNVVNSSKFTTRRFALTDDHVCEGFVSTVPHCPQLPLFKTTFHAHIPRAEWETEETYNAIRLRCSQLFQLYRHHCA
jgi:hypothetical protein